MRRHITKGNTTRQIVYQDNGNITSIDGVGTMIYGGGAGVSPYEVTGLTPESGQPPYRQRAVTYNSFDRPSTIAEGAYSAGMVYNADERDGIVAMYRYDPWGRLVDNSGVPYTPGNEPTLFLGRGFTSHEHLTKLGLIYANARLYDPLLGRFLSPDPYVQDPGFTQNYNRYSYCLNNPLKYTDESGEIIGTILTAVLGFPIAFAYGGLLAPIVSLFDLKLGNKMTNDAWSIYSQKVSNAWKIDMAPFQTDENLSTGEQIWSVVSRFTWELPQTLLGNTISHIKNLTGDVSVEYYNGATLVNSTSSGNGGGMTLGSYIQGVNLVADPLKRPIFAHEYGHTLQSKILGPLFIPLIAPPSFIGSGTQQVGLHDHHNEWYEVWANNLSVNYFNSIGRADVANKLQSYFPVDFEPESFFIKTLLYYICLFSLFL